MTRKQRAFVNYVKRTRPKTVQNLRPRYHARFLAEGAFRQTFSILGLVIKFPRYYDDPKENRDHSWKEAQAVRRMLHDPKLLALKRYAPTILHYDRTRGVTIMPKYKAVRHNKHFVGFAATFERMLIDLIPSMRYGFDNTSSNFGYNSEGYYVVLDCGLIGEAA